MDIQTIVDIFFLLKVNFNLSSDSCEEEIEFFIKAIEHGAIDIAWTTTYASESSRGLIDEKAAKCVEVIFYKIFMKKLFSILGFRACSNSGD